MHKNNPLSKQLTIGSSKNLVNTNNNFAKKYSVDAIARRKNAK